MARRIDGREAIYMAIESAKRGPVQIEPFPADSDPNALTAITDSGALAPTNAGLDISEASAQRRPPPRVRKPQRNSDRCFAPTPDLAAHREAMRQAFGNTLSDEFAEAMLGELVSALRPGPFDCLDEAKLNAAIAVVASKNARTELQALVAVQIAATGFAGLKFMRQSQYQMDEESIHLYGGYANKLFRLQLEMIRTLDRLQRGNKQTMEVRHVHIHSGGQGVVGIVNAAGEREGDSQK